MQVRGMGLGASGGAGVNERRIARRTEGHVAATTPIPPPSAAGGQATGSAPRLARSLAVERYFVTDREAMAAALRVVLGLPRILPRHRGQESR